MAEVGAAGDTATKAPRSLRPKDRKERILDAAGELFAERGFGAVPIGDIAAQVGITGPAIYRHYRTKEALLESLLERTVNGFADVVAAAGDVELEALVAGVVAHVLDHPAQAAAYMSERSRFSPPGPPRLVDAERRFRKEWKRALQRHYQHLDPQRVAIRQQAVLAGMAAAARDQLGVPRPRLDELLTRSTVAILRTPRAQARRTGDDAADGRGWEPPLGRRDKILGAALALFRLKGVAGVGMDEIGAAAGISGPTVYHYYPSKADLVLDACHRASERLSVGTDDALRRAWDPMDAVVAMVRSYVNLASHDLDLVIVAGNESAPFLVAEERRIQRRRQEVRDKWAATLCAARPELRLAEAELLVRALFPTLNGAMTACDARSDLFAEVERLGVSYLLGDESFDATGVRR